MLDLLRMALESHPSLPAVHIEAASTKRAGAIVAFAKEMTRVEKSTYWELSEASVAVRIKRLLKDEDDLFLIAVDGDRVVGELITSHLHFNPERNFMFINQIGLLLEYRHHGIGKILLDKAIEKTKALKLSLIELITESHNHQAIAWYERHGFKYAGDARGGRLYQLHL